MPTHIIIKLLKTKENKTILYRTQAKKNNVSPVGEQCSNDNGFLIGSHGDERKVAEYS